MRFSKDNTVKKSLILIVLILLFQICFLSIIALANAKIGSPENPYNGLPKIRLNVDSLDLDKEDLIYCGLDIAIFYDPDLDGDYEVLPNDKKIKRIITRSKQINLNLGNIKEYQIGIPHKIMVRTLYVASGTNQDKIIIANSENDDGWKDVPNTTFKPSYFINAPTSGYIDHTSKWEENRITFNKVYKGSNKERDGAVFWAGERLMLYIETAIPVNKVVVKINEFENSEGEDYTTTLTEYKEHTKVEGAAVYEGFLWDKDMINSIGNYIPKEKEVFLEVYDDENNMLERKKVKIVFHNKDAFYRIRKAI